LTTRAAFRLPLKSFMPNHASSAMSTMVAMMGSSRRIQSSLIHCPEATA
jgi:hypothetical protein